MMNAESRLIILLRTIAVAASLAVVPVFMPHGWMDLIHRSFGLGELPELPPGHLPRPITSGNWYTAGD